MTDFEEPDTNVIQSSHIFGDKPSGAIATVYLRKTTETEKTAGKSPKQSRTTLTWTKVKLNFSEKKKLRAKPDVKPEYIPQRISADITMRKIL